MEQQLRVWTDQLGRMRGMTRYYHERFFADVRLFTLVIIGLFLVGWWGIPEGFLLVPVVALFGATMTAFDASYLIFARHYAERLEHDINSQLGPDTLLASQLEATYLFPLNDRKIVVAAVGPGFSWFGFMTLFITGIGMMSFGLGLVLGYPTLVAHGGLWPALYVIALGVFTVAALATGWWWFVRGEGERRLRTVLGD